MNNTLNKDWGGPSNPLPHRPRKSHDTAVGFVIERRVGRKGSGSATNDRLWLANSINYTTKTSAVYLRQHSS